MQMRLQCHPLIGCPCPNLNPICEAGSKSAAKRPGVTVLVTAATNLTRATQGVSSNAPPGGHLGSLLHRLDSDQRKPTTRNINSSSRFGWRDPPIRDESSCSSSARQQRDEEEEEVFSDRAGSNNKKKINDEI